MPNLTVAATIALPRERSEVRRHLIARWVDPDKKGVVTARVLAGGERRAGQARTILPAFDAEVAGSEARQASPEPQIFEVEVYKVCWRYALHALAEHETLLEMVYIQKGFMARVPGIRGLMAKAMEREKARLRRWAAPGA